MPDAVPVPSAANASFLMTTIAGIMGLWPAILADTGATVLVTANAMRLLSARRHCHGGPRRSGHACVLAGPRHS